MTENIVNIIGDIPHDIKNNQIINLTRKNDEIFQIGGYPARFVPELPRWAISKYTNKDDTILDPFCGSGTTLIESLRQGRNAIGIDNNPYAQLLSQVKTNSFSNKDYENSLNILKKKVTSINSYTLPEFRSRDYWHDKPAMIALGKLKSLINTIEDIKMHDFFLLVLADLTNDVSKVGSGQILQARRKDHSKEKNYTEFEVIDLFFKKSNRYANILIKNFDSYNKNNNSKIIADDARKFNHSMFDAIVTSPPYINAIDYIWASKLKLHWTALVSSDKDRLDKYSNEVGTERVNEVKIKDIGVEQLNNDILDILNAKNYKASKGQNELRAKTTYKYFEDMRKHFEISYNKLKDNGVYCLVIGDNTICKVPIKTTDYLTIIAEQIGFTKEMSFNLLLKNKKLNLPRNVDFANSIKFDKMVVLRKN